MDAKHTPGPWFHNRAGGLARAVWNTRGKNSDEESEILICLADGMHERCLPSPKEIDANMVLIAAAPDLLAACKAAAEELHGYADSGGSVKAEHLCGQLLAAIALAEGRSSHAS